MKTQEELNALKNEIEALNRKLAELSEDELEQVMGGNAGSAADIDFKTQFNVDKPEQQYEHHLYTLETKESATEKFVQNN